MANRHAKLTCCIKSSNGWRLKPLYVNDDGKLIPIKRDARYESIAVTTDDAEHVNEYAELVKYDANDEQQYILGKTKKTRFYRDRSRKYFKRCVMTSFSYQLSADMI